MRLLGGRRAMGKIAERGVETEGMANVYSWEHVES